MDYLAQIAGSPVGDVAVVVGVALFVVKEAFSFATKKKGEDSGQKMPDGCHQSFKSLARDQDRHETVVSQGWKENGEAHARQGIYMEQQLQVLKEIRDKT
jgi:hypothetical protein